MKLKKKATLRVLEKSTTPLTLKQIRQRLGLNKQHHAKLKAVLNKLVAKKKLHLQNGKFSAGLAQPPASAKGASGSVGFFQKTRQGFGFVSLEEGADVYVGKKDQKGAMDGDRVEIVLVSSRHPKGRRGKIVRIAERPHKQFLARLARGTRVSLALPLQEKSSLPPVVIAAENDLAAAQSGDLICGILVPPPPGTKELYGKILRILPVQSVDELALDLILTENQIATEFSKEALQEAQSFPKRVVYRAQSARTDLRHLGFVTIDGQDAQDFDDAVYAETEKSGYRLWVSIADVAHYVQPNQPLDQAAYQRGTSVYFPTHAIPMLPQALSNDLCSLRPKVNRLTLTCEMAMDAKGEVCDYWIYESLIQSQARLNYEEVAEYLAGRDAAIPDCALQKSLQTLHKLSQILAKKRFRRGAVDFSFPEYCTTLNQQGQVVGFRKAFQSSSMKLIEQLMLEANETVARHCIRHKLPALYRVHEPPDLSKMEKFQRTFWYLGLGEKLLELDDSKNINKLLQKIKKHPNLHQIQLMLLKSMALACYQTRNKGHFGLAAPYYTHFTSPIRRYPDLLVHRVLKSHIAAERTGRAFRGKPLDSGVAEHLSQQERKAETAERQSHDLMKVIFLEQHVGQSLHAQVMALHFHGLQVELTDLCIECFLPLESLNDDFYHYDETRLVLVGEHLHHVVQAGDGLQLRLVRTDRLNRKLEFELDTWLTDQAA